MLTPSLEVRYYSAGSTLSSMNLGLNPSLRVHHIYKELPDGNHIDYTVLRLYSPQWVLPSLSHYLYP